MANEITGRIHSISPTQQIATKDGQSLYLKREFVLDCTRHDPWTGEAGYENLVKMEFSGDKCQLLDAFTAGQVVTVAFTVQGVKYKRDGKDEIFTTIRPYKIEERKGGPRPQAQPAAQAQQMPPQAQAQPQQPQQAQQPYGTVYPQRNDPLPF